MRKIAISLLFLPLLFFVGSFLSGHIHDVARTQSSEVISWVVDHFFFFVLVNVLLYFFEVIRFHWISKLMGIRVRFKDSFCAIGLNIFFAWLTPGAFLGAPASAYYLYKKGYPLVESTYLSFVRSFSVIIASALTTLVIVRGGLIEGVGSLPFQRGTYYVLLGISFYIIFLIFASYWFPEKWMKFRAIKKTAYLTRKIISRWWLYLAGILPISLVLNFLLVCFIPYISYKESFEESVYQALLFLSYLLLMPTPGAAGLSELGAPAFFEGLLPQDQIVPAVLSMRISMLIIQLVVGFAIMLLTLKKVIEIKDLKKFKDSKA